MFDMQKCKREDGLMFQVNDFIIYGNNGSCKVTDIRHEKDFNGNLREYYILQPVYLKTSTIMTPVDNTKVVMRVILGEDEANNLISSIADSEIPWVDNDKVRNKEYRDLSRTCDSENWIQLIRTLYVKKLEKISDGKKLSQADEIIMQSVEKLLFGEIAISLQMELDKVKELVIGKIEENMKVDKI